MNTRQILTATALAGILSLAAQQARAQHDHAAAVEGSAATEKCYGVAKKAMNDCSANAHACAGQSAMDGDKTEWLVTPAGLCEKLVNGSLTPGVEEKSVAPAGAEKAE
jgi:uncharacterized membrane protein